MASPTKKSNFLQLALGGVAIETVSPAVNQPLATVAYDSTDGGFYEIVEDAVQARVWVPLGPGSGFNTPAGKYYFADNSVPGPRALYSTPQAALAAAIADGHGASAPAALLGYPGTYTLTGGTMALPAGFTLAAVSQAHAYAEGDIFPAGLDTQIVGDITVTGPGNRQLVGIALHGTLTVTGAPTDAIAVMLAHCAVLGQTGHEAVRWTTNTDGAMSVFTSRLEGTGAPSLRTSASAFVRDTTLVDPAGAPSLLLTDVAFVELTDSNVGAVQIDDTGVLDMLTSSLFSTASTTVTVAVGGLFNAQFSGVGGSAGGPTFAGLGQYGFADCAMAPGGTKAAGARTSPFYVQRLRVEALVNAGDTAPFDADVVEVDPAAGTVAVMLPTGSSLWAGHPLTVKSLNTNGTVNATPQAGDQIDGLGLGVAWALVGPGTGAWPAQRFIWSEARNRWLSV